MTGISKQDVALIRAQLDHLIGPEKLESKDKKYLASLEKSLANFDSATEWADYISSLTRLAKSLQAHSRPQWIPHEHRISRCLARCVVPLLPSGVHRKALEVYETVFKILGQELLLAQMAVWIPGLLPLMLYASIALRPLLVAVLDTHILGLEALRLRVVAKVVLMSLLPGIDDETSELHDQTFALIVKLQQNLRDDCHFWQCLCMVIVTAPDRRLGALVWCQRRMPTFSPVDGILDVEASLMLEPNAGLLIRAFVSALNDDQLLVQRGFFDLLISRVKLGSSALVGAATDDLEMLVMAACLTVLRKDMLINRRLWHWLLGVDNDIFTPNLEGDSRAHNGAKVKYFEQYGEEVLVRGFLKLINSPVISERVKGYKMSIAFMDKWEIGTVISKRVFLPFLKSVQRSLVEQENRAGDFKELLQSASGFFDTIESVSIWRTCFGLINVTDEAELQDNLQLMLFILRQFNVNEEDMVQNHLPLMAINLLIIQNQYVDRGQEGAVVFEIVSEILGLISGVLAPTDELVEVDCLDVFARIKSYYTEAEPEQSTVGLGVSDDVANPLSDDALESSDKVDGPFSKGQLVVILNQLFNTLLSRYLETERETELFYKYSQAYLEFLALVRSDVNLARYRNQQLVDSVVARGNEILRHSEYFSPARSANFERDLILDYYGGGKVLVHSSSSREVSPAKNPVAVTFGIAILYRQLQTYLEPEQQLSLLELTLGLVHSVLATANNKYQIETVKLLTDLEEYSDRKYFSLSLGKIYYQLNHLHFDKIIEIAKIVWNQLGGSAPGAALPSAFPVSRLPPPGMPVSPLITIPLNIICSEFKLHRNNQYLIIDWLNDISTNLDQILSILLVPLVQYDFVTCQGFDNVDDFQYLRYQLQLLVNLICVDKAKVLGQINGDINFMDAALLLEVFGMGRDTPSSVSYKSLLIYVTFRLLDLTFKIDFSAGWQVFELQDFNDSVLLGLDLLELLLENNELNVDIITNNLVEISYKYLSLPAPSPLVIVKFFHLVSTTISSSRHRNIALSILHVNKDQPIRARDALQVHQSMTYQLAGDSASTASLNYIEYLVYSLASIESASIESAPLLKSWARVLVDNLLNLSDCIFQIIVPVTAAICAKITAVFHAAAALAAKADGDQIVGVLMKTLEELLLYGHMFLSASEMGAQTQGTRPQGELGFLTSVMAGVFSVESPDVLNAEESSRLSILVSFEAVVKACYEIWLWGEDQVTRVRDSTGANSGIDCSQTVEYVGSKLKFKSRRLLEKLYNTERLQVLHTLMLYDTKDKSVVFKLLHTLDNSRPQLTIPHIFNTITLKVSPEVSENRTSLMASLTEKRIAAFLMDYVTSLDVSATEDIYQDSGAFFKLVTGSPSRYRPVMPVLLECCALLVFRLSAIKFGELKNVRREAVDYFFKILTSMLSTRSLSTEESDETVVAAVTDSDSPISQESLFLSLAYVVPLLDNAILADGRAGSVVNLMILNVVQPILKAKKFLEMSGLLLDLIELISFLPVSKGNKMWRTLINDIFTDPQFFQLKDPALRKRMAKIVNEWIVDEPEKVAEFIGKIQPYSRNSSALFNWNEGEILSKVLKLKRFSFLLMLAANNQHAALVNELMDKLGEILATSKDELTAQVFLCLRAILLRVPEQHLNQHWIFIYSELEKTLTDFAVKCTAVELDKTDGQTLNQLVARRTFLQASKLLDLLVTLGFEEFAFDQWVFIDDTNDRVSGKKNLVFGIVEKIAKLKSYKLPDSNNSQRVKIPDGHENRPLLEGFQNYLDVALLRPFFDHLSYHSFEKMYAMQKANIRSCEDDLYNDLFD